MRDPKTGRFISAKTNNDKESFVTYNDPYYISSYYYDPKPVQKIKNPNEMNSDQIWYRDLVEAGFNFDEQSDSVFEAQYGFPYCIVTKDLTKKIYLEWDQVTQKVEMIRIDSPKECNIMSKMPIKNLAHMKELIEFFCENKAKK